MRSVKTFAEEQLTAIEAQLQIIDDTKHALAEPSAPQPDALFDELEEAEQDLQESLVMLGVNIVSMTAQAHMEKEDDTDGAHDVIATAVFQLVHLLTYQK